MKFSVQKEEIARLKEFNNFIKNLSLVSPLPSTSLFEVKENKLTVYAYGTGNAAASYAKAVFDVSNDEDFLFIGQFTQILGFIEKTKSDEVSIEYDGAASIKIKGSSYRGSIQQNSIIKPTEDEIKETTGMLDTILSLESMKNAVTIPLSAEKLEKIKSLSDLTKITSTNDKIFIGSDRLTTGDSNCVVKLSNDIIDTNELFFNRNVINLIDEKSILKISTDKTWTYIEIPTLSFCCAFVPPASKWQFFSDEEISAAEPDVNDEHAIIEVKTEEFFEMLNQFDGMFDSATWKWKQIRLKHFSEQPNTMVCQYDNMATDVQTSFDFVEIENTLPEQDYMFVIPTLYFKVLKGFLTGETFKIMYNTKDVFSEHGATIVIYDDNVNIMYAKMTE